MNPTNWWRRADVGAALVLAGLAAIEVTRAQGQTTEEISVSRGARHARRRAARPEGRAVQQSAARRRSVRLRDLRAAPHPRVGRDQGPVAPVERGVPARRRHAHHRARRPSSPGAQRRAAAGAGEGHAEGRLDQHDGRADGHRAPSALRREQVGLHLVPQARRHGEKRGREGLPAGEQLDPARHVGRQSAHRRPRHLRRRRRGHGDVAGSRSARTGCCT